MLSHVRSSRAKLVLWRVALRRLIVLVEIEKNVKRSFIKPIKVTMYTPKNGFSNRSVTFFRNPPYNGNKTIIILISNKTTAPEISQNYKQCNRHRGRWLIGGAIHIFVFCVINLF